MGVRCGHQLWVDYCRQKRHIHMHMDMDMHMHMHMCM